MPRWGAALEAENLSDLLLPSVFCRQQTLWSPGLPFGKQTLRQLACVSALIHGGGLQRTDVGTAESEGEGGGTISSCGPEWVSAVRNWRSAWFHWRLWRSHRKAPQDRLVKDTGRWHCPPVLALWGCLCWAGSRRAAWRGGQAPGAAEAGCWPLTTQPGPESEVGKRVWDGVRWGWEVSGPGTQVRRVLQKEASLANTDSTSFLVGSKYDL